MSEIEIRHLTKKFQVEGHTITALNDVSLQIEKGDIYGIIGMSGAGKSTLVRSINYLEKPTDGQVLIEGVNLGSLTARELRKKRSDIGMIFQNFNLLEQKNVLKNVLFPLEVGKRKDQDGNQVKLNKNELKQIARQLLKTVKLEEKEKAYPSQLSGGQKQRVAIARALATNPKILLCDEATSALDPQTTDSILKLLKEINESLGITIVIITHSMSVVTEICNKVAIIDNGKLVEEGLVSSIFENPKSDAAKELISGKKLTYSPVNSLESKKAVRIVFSDNSAYEPVIANTILKFGLPVNILKADTRNLSGKAVGEMILGLPEDDTISREIIAYLRERGLKVTEVGNEI
ncbi:MAG: ATP-binding cassette domain-containing protein [Lachnospiraceae bacterium]|nr:ATP-binding cassette domain-containing protein [Lachnospiraceae bacterium]